MERSKVVEKLTTFDPAGGLTSDDAIAAFIEEAFRTKDAGYIDHAFDVVARAKDMAQTNIRSSRRRPGPRS